MHLRLDVARWISMLRRKWKPKHTRWNRRAAHDGPGANGPDAVAASRAYAIALERLARLRRRAFCCVYVTRIKRMASAGGLEEKPSRKAFRGSIVGGCPLPSPRLDGLGSGGSISANCILLVVSCRDSTNAYLFRTVSKGASESSHNLKARSISFWTKGPAQCQGATPLTGVNLPSG